VAGQRLKVYGFVKEGVRPLQKDRGGYVWLTPEAAHEARPRVIPECAGNVDLLTLLVSDMGQLEAHPDHAGVWVLRDPAIFDYPTREVDLDAEAMDGF
jgi:hypothetical protein